VIGVAPAGYTGLLFDWHPHPELYLPTQTYERVAERVTLARTGPSFAIWGRPKPGVTRGEAEAQLGLVASQLDAPFDEMYFAHGAVTVVPFSQSRLWPGRRTPTVRLLSLLFGVSLLVLLIGCSNVASFLGGRRVSRCHELAVRTAMSDASSSGREVWKRCPGNGSREPRGIGPWITRGYETERALSAPNVPTM